MASPAVLVFKIFPGEDPRFPLQQVHMETLITPLLRAEDCVTMIQITVIYLLSVIAKFLNL